MNVMRCETRHIFSFLTTSIPFLRTSLCGNRMLKNPPQENQTLKMDRSIKRNETTLHESKEIVMTGLSFFAKHKPIFSKIYSIFVVPFDLSKERGKNFNTKWQIFQRSSSLGTKRRKSNVAYAQLGRLPTRRSLWIPSPPIGRRKSAGDWAASSCSTSSPVMAHRNVSPSASPATTGSSVSTRTRNYRPSSPKRFLR